MLLAGRLVTARTLDGVEVVGMYHDAPGFLGAVMVLTGNPNLASSRALQPARVAAITRDRFRELVHADEQVEREIMQIFGPIYQRAGALEQQREKLAALGNMAAGLAHELNNPAAAARRSASELADVLDALADVVAHFVESGLEREQAAQLVALQREARERASAFDALDALDAADAEDAVLGWLEAHEVPEAWRPAPTFAAAGLDAEWLDGRRREGGPGAARRGGVAGGVALGARAGGRAPREHRAHLHAGGGREGVRLHGPGARAGGRHPRRPGEHAHDPGAQAQEGERRGAPRL